MNTWQKSVSNKRNLLSDPNCPAALTWLSESWVALKKHSPKDQIEALESQCDNPLSAICEIVTRGHYPPPEWLLTLDIGFEEYLHREGKVTLEEVFFPDHNGPPGSYAKEKRRSYEKFMFDYLCEKDGRSRIKVAEEICERMALAISPESFLRRMNRLETEESG